MPSVYCKKEIPSSGQVLSTWDIDIKPVGGHYQSMSKIKACPLFFCFSLACYGEIKGHVRFDHCSQSDNHFLVTILQ